MRLTYSAGERMFVDFSGDKATWCDPETGEVHEAEVFVAVLGCSGMLYVEATRGQDLSSWVGAHVHAFEAYGGVAEITVPDNFEGRGDQGLLLRPRAQPHLRRAGRPLFDGRAAHPGAPAPGQSGRRGRRVDRRALGAGPAAPPDVLLARRAQRGHQRAGGRGERPAVPGRADLEEGAVRGARAPALRPLPAARYELAEWKKVTVNIDYHVEGPDKTFYSVPYQLVRERLELRASATTIEVFKGGRRVASHVRAHGRRRYITDPGHMPASHRAHAEWTPSRLIAWGRSVSADTGTFVEALLASRPHPEHAYRACLGLMRLARRYGDERLSSACARALAIGSISYSSVKSILAEGLDRLALPGTEAAPAPARHENLRGAAYWSEEA